VIKNGAKWNGNDDENGTVSKTFLFIPIFLLVYAIKIAITD